MYRYLALLLFTLNAYANPDYTNLDQWLCHPEQSNFCAQDQSSTVIAADGSLSQEAFTPALDPEIDCFYVYPTVSMDKGGNSDLLPNHEESRVIEAQFARFGAACRTYAPIYRQVTLTALRSRILGEAMPVDGQLGYNDVQQAWEHYLTHENNGRGVILIGHSQGSGVLTQLIRAEIEGQPIQNQVIGAYLIGSSNVLNEPGKDVGGTFKHMPLCRAADQTQCIVTFASFRSDAPPPDNSRFGRARNPEMRHLQTACNLPGALNGGTAELQAYLSSTGDSLGASSPQPPWTKTNPKINTPFVQVPGLLTGECVEHDGFSYLSVTVNADPNDARTDEIGGDVVINEQVAKDWGLHLIDMHLAMGNLVELAKVQGEAYVREASSEPPRPPVLQ
ncbi:MAG: hypothetical protein ACI96M_003311 [Candidatus Azotimanducaceae bacterium]|jgi:hypothetical protein